MTGAASPSSAADQAAPDTVELPTLDGLISSGTARAAQATQTIAIHYDVEAAQTQAAEEAQKSAAETKKKAEAKAKKEREEAAARALAEKQAEERAAEAAKEAAEAPRATRSAERTEAPAPQAATPAPSSAATGSASAIVNFAYAQVGKAYVLGSTGPSAFDCSGLTSAAYKQAGINLPRTSQAQSSMGTDVPLSQVRPGDILYWGGKGSAYHVAIYVGDGKFVGAQNSGTGVVERDMSWDQPSGAVRVL